MEKIIKDGVEYVYDESGDLTYEKYPNGDEYCYEIWIDDDGIKHCSVRKV